MSLTTKFIDFASKIFLENQNFSPIEITDTSYLESFALLAKQKRSSFGKNYWFFKTLPATLDEQQAKVLALERKQVLKRPLSGYNVYAFVYVAESLVNSNILNFLANFNEIYSVRYISPLTSIVSFSVFFDATSGTIFRPTKEYHIFSIQKAVNKIVEWFSSHLITPFLQSK
ncbi:MAG: hypothetical protein ACFFBD_05075 [Candidatus Hodarchaeota archaeon]